MKDMTDNELIARFMGRQLLIDKIQLSDRVETTYYDKETDEVVYLFYDESWDWLMPVIEKIEAIDGWKVIIFRKCCDIQHDEEDDHQIEITALPSKIKAVYKAVVEFINWHNSQTSIN